MSILSDLVNLNLSDASEKIIAEYIWIGGSGMDLRSKARTLNGPVSDPSTLPKWNYDGSSTGQAPGEDPIFKDPFRRGNNILVMCDAYTPDGQPIPTNKRHNAAKIFSHPDVVAEEPWYGIEQEYTLLQRDVHWPIGWPLGVYPGPQGPYYCGVGADKAFGRDIVNSHYKVCLHAGINISGINGEVICSPFRSCLIRYILFTKSMRNDGGYEVIKKAIENLKLRHKEHIAAYGKGKERRLTGHHETADINTFSWGVANGGASVRVGRETEREGKGYFEDRRPASNHYS
ncbi:hypothetical protein K2173_026335 [Erythroxylum novogranatense]|uniref:glutamine synthetase n=1 Tax=Erythroxylum novogranatense TaxID=1862640 RepID=A0AAV8SNY8_9ROSI|nr:hypothetical protein K2173_026335 [Erythroxylum novogranatense]